MKCKQTNCEKEAVGEAYYPGIDKWHPYCQDHYDTRGRMKRRKFTQDSDKKRSQSNSGTQPETGAEV